VSADASLADDLILCLVTVSGTLAAVSSIARDEHTLSVTEHDMRRSLMRVNTRKAAGPEGISG